MSSALSWLPRSPAALIATGLASALVLLLALPLVGLAVTSTPSELIAALRHPVVWPALSLSLKTTAVSLGLVVVAGTPLAWFLARSERRFARFAEALVELPVVVPPAVVGVALLLTFGRSGLLGPLVVAVGGPLPFTTGAVVVAQLVVSAPFYVRGAVTGFREVDDDLILVARTLGADPMRAFFRVAIPSALPALVGGAALAWARAVGEFGATLLFAGNMPGRTQTMPLAIYTALEADLSVARAVALILALVAFATLLVMRAMPALASRRAHVPRRQS